MGCILFSTCRRKIFSELIIDCVYILYLGHFCLYCCVTAVLIIMNWPLKLHVDINTLLTFTISVLSWIHPEMKRTPIRKQLWTHLIHFESNILKKVVGLNQNIQHLRWMFLMTSLFSERCRADSSESVCLFTSLTWGTVNKVFTQTYLSLDLNTRWKVPDATDQSAWHLSIQLLIFLNHHQSKHL